MTVLLESLDISFDNINTVATCIKLKRGFSRNYLDWSGHTGSLAWIVFIAVEAANWLEVRSDVLDVTGVDFSLASQTLFPESKDSLFSDSPSVRAPTESPTPAHPELTKNLTFIARHLD